MKIRGIIWLDSVIEKIEGKHGVSCEEVRQVLQGRAAFRFVENGHRRDENVYAAMPPSGAAGRADTWSYSISRNQIIEH